MRHCHSPLTKSVPAPLVRALFVSAALALALLVPAAAGQSLSERIAVVRRQRQAAPNATKDTHRTILAKLLTTTVTTGFDEVPAGDALDFMRVRLDLPLVVRSIDDTAGHGLDPRTVVTIPAADRTALTLLEAILEQCSDPEPCTWQLRAGMLEVGTLARLAAPAAQTTRVYPIDDLLFEPARFDDAPALGIVLQDPYTSGGALAPGGTSGGVIVPSPRSGTQGGGRPASNGAQAIVDLITDTIDPPGWQRNGGTRASIRVVDGALVVRGPDYVHRMIGGYPHLVR